MKAITLTQPQEALVAISISGEFNAETINKFRLVTDEEYAKAMLADAILSGEVTVNVSMMKIGGYDVKVMSCSLCRDIEIVVDGCEARVLDKFIEAQLKI
jgi:hypothetical protein